VGLLDEYVTEFYAMEKKSGTGLTFSWEEKPVTLKP
jgi:hypothetical protein